MTELRKATIGSVLHGTLKSTELVEAFANELEHQVTRNAEAWRGEAGGAVRNELMSLVAEAREFDPERLDPRAVESQAADIVDALTEELQMFAPDGHYFGAHPGDGADFGYWEQES
jgi:hypothetical protein